MATRLGGKKTAMATKLGKKTATATEFWRNLFNASTAGPLVKSAQVFRLRKEASKERPATK